MRIPVSTEVKFRVTFRNADGTVADPTAVTFRIKDPAGTETLLTYGVDVAFVKEATGKYSVLRTLGSVGDYKARFKGTGAVNAATRDMIVAAEPTALTP